MVARTSLCGAYFEALPCTKPQSTVVNQSQEASAALRVARATAKHNLVVLNSFVAITKALKARGSCDECRNSLFLKKIEPGPPSELVSALSLCMVGWSTHALPIRFRSCRGSTPSSGGGEQRKIELGGPGSRDDVCMDREDLSGNTS